MSSTAKTETVFEPIPGKSFETAPQTHFKQEKDTTRAQIPLARVSPIKAFFVWARQWTAISQAGKRKQYSCEKYRTVSLRWLLLGELSLTLGGGDHDEETVSRTVM